jgi:hypothetical protein
LALFGREHDSEFGEIRRHHRGMRFAFQALAFSRYLLADAVLLMLTSARGIAPSLSTCRLFPKACPDGRF